MKPYTSVAFNRREREIFQRANIHLTVVADQVNDPATKVKGAQAKAEGDWNAKARACLSIGQDYTSGTYDNLVLAIAVWTHLRQVCEREAQLDYWRDIYRDGTGHELVFSTEPTSAWHMAEVIAESRASFIPEIDAALDIAHRALLKASRVPNRREMDDDG